MSLREQIEKDMNNIYSVKDFAQVVTHNFQGSQEQINAIFSETSDVVLDDSKGYEFEGATAGVPCITVKKSDADNITSNSTFIINEVEYEVIQKDTHDYIVKIYLGYNNE